MKGASLFKTFTSNANRVKLDSDVDYTFSTDQMIRGSFRLRAQVPEEKFDEDWHADGAMPNPQFMLANLRDAHDETEISVSAQNIDPLLLNKSLKSVKMKPTASYNYIECMPDFQAHILPYLSDTRIRDSQLNGFQENAISFLKRDLVERTARNNQFNPANYILDNESLIYEPSESGYLFLRRDDYEDEEPELPGDEPPEDEGGVTAHAEWAARLALYTPWVAATVPQIIEKAHFYNSPISDTVAVGAPGYAAWRDTTMQIKWRDGVAFPADIRYNGVGAALNQNAIGTLGVGLPLRPVADIYDGSGLVRGYRINFNNYMFEIPLGADNAFSFLNQNTDNARTPYFRFRFYDDVALEVRFDEHGFGYTQKIGGENDLGPFHVFRVFDREANTATGAPEVPGEEYPDPGGAPPVVVLATNPTGQVVNQVEYDMYVDAHAQWQIDVPLRAAWEARAAAYNTYLANTEPFGDLLFPGTAEERGHARGDLPSSCGVSAE